MADEEHRKEVEDILEEGIESEDEYREAQNLASDLAKKVEEGTADQEDKELLRYILEEGGRYWEKKGEEAFEETRSY